MPGPYGRGWAPLGEAYALPANTDEGWAPLGRGICFAREYGRGLGANPATIRYVIAE
jgi:hypothetical protein